MFYNEVKLFFKYLKTRQSVNELTRSWLKLSNKLILDLFHFVCARWLELTNLGMLKGNWPKALKKKKN